MGNQMMNKIMLIMCCSLVPVAVLSFADDKQVVEFDHSKVVYNDKANKDIRAKKLVIKQSKAKELNKKKAQDEHDQKNGLADKTQLNDNHSEDGKNEQYDKRLTVKF